MSKGACNYSCFVNPDHAKLLKLTGMDLHFTTAQGTKLATQNGKVYYDWLSGFGALNLGHNPPQIMVALKNALAQNAPNLLLEQINPYAGDVAQKVLALFPSSFNKVYFSLSGSAVVDAAIKTAILTNKRKKILALKKSFHGISIGAMALSNAKEFGILTSLSPASFAIEPDVEQVEKHLQSKEYAAFILESVQIEAGVAILGPKLLQQIAQICQKTGTLLIVDEIQSGLGRSGQLMATDFDTVAADIVLLGKALGGGLLPISAMVYSDSIYKKAFGKSIGLDILASTYDSYPLGLVAASAFLDCIREESFLKELEQKCHFFYNKLLLLNAHPMVTSVSVCGLIGAIHIKKIEHPWFHWEHLGISKFEGYPSEGMILNQRLFKRGFLTQIFFHNWSSLRLEPPLIVSKKEIELLLEHLTKELDWLASHE